MLYVIWYLCPICHVPSVAALWNRKLAFIGTYRNEFCAWHYERETMYIFTIVNQREEIGLFINTF